MADGGMNGGGGDNDAQMTNWFDIVTKKHMNEFGLLIKCAQKVMFSP